MTTNRLIDTNVLVYRYDPRFPDKQRVATELLWSAIGTKRIAIPHQAVLEFVAVTTRPRVDLDGQPLLAAEAAYREARDLMRQFPIIYPDSQVLLTAMDGAAGFGLSWFDAHLWAYAQVHEIPEILSEDFQHGRHYGDVRVVDPFLSAADSVHELPPMYDELPA